MARLTISLPETLAAAAAARAGDQKRSASSYVALLIEEDVKTHAHLPLLTHFLGELHQAILDQPELVPVIKKIIIAKRRARKVAA